MPAMRERAEGAEAVRDEAMAKFANLEMHSKVIAKAADRMRAHEKKQDEMLRGALSRADKAERRVRVLKAEVAELKKCLKALGAAYSQVTEGGDD
jgi:seryl-tRNA synthetase